MMKNNMLDYRQLFLFLFHPVNGKEHAMRRMHIGSIIILICGLSAIIPGMMTLLGMGGWVHELLNQPLGAIALLVIGGSCVLAALFPVFTTTYLTRKEMGKTPFEEDETGD